MYIIFPITTIFRSTTVQCLGAGGSLFGRIGPDSLPPVAILDQVYDNPYRLPRMVVHRRYYLRLVPDLPSASFTGDVDIAVTVVSSTNEVVLNAIELEVDEAWVTTADGRQLDAAVTLDPEWERASLVLPEELPAGEATVSLRFRGQLNDKLRGFYRSTFTDEHGAEQVIATTQFEATDARRR